MGLLLYKFPQIRKEHKCKPKRIWKKVKRHF